MKLKLHLLVSSFMLALSFNSMATDGVSGNYIIVQPEKDENISKPGNITAQAGDIVALKYSYAVVPSAIPKKAKWESSDKKIVDISSLGVRYIRMSPMIVGSGSFVYFFEARKEGTAKVRLTIDDNTYNYTIKVIE